MRPMSMLSEFKTLHPNLFAYQKAEEINPHDYLLAKTLLRLLPVSVTPNKVTLFRIIFTPAVFFLVLYDYYLVGIISFLLLAFSDAVDGSLARTSDRITDFGKIFDPLADKFLIGSMVLVLVFQNYPFWLGFAVLGIEIIIILATINKKYKFKTIRGANIWGKIKMHLQVIAVFLTLAGLLWQFPSFFTIAAGLFGLSLGFAIASLFTRGL